MLFGEVPDPDCAIAEHDLLAGLAPAATGWPIGLLLAGFDGGADGLGLALDGPAGGL
jgi:hypothetical protein